MSDVHHGAGAFSPASLLAAIKAAPRRRDGLVNDDGSPNGWSIKESNMYVGVMKTSQNLWLNVCLLPASGTWRSGHRTSEDKDTYLDIDPAVTHRFSHSSSEPSPLAHCCFHPA